MTATEGTVVSGDIVSRLLGRGRFDEAVREFTRNRVDFEPKIREALTQQLAAAYSGPVDIVGKLGGTAFVCEGAVATGLLGCRAAVDSVDRREGIEAEVNARDNVLARIAGCISEVAAYYGVGRIHRVALSVPGMLNADGTLAETMSNIPCFTAGFSFQDELPGILARACSGLGDIGPLGVDISQDGLAACRGETGIFGTCPGCQHSMLFVIVGTGIGARLMVSGRPFRGDKRVNFFHHEGPLHLRFSGTDADPDYEYVALETGGRPVKAVWAGAQDLESRTSGLAIAREAVKRMRAQDGAPADIREINDIVGGDAGRVTARILGEAAVRGNGFARDILATKGRELGIGIAVLIMESRRHFKNYVLPDHIVFGSGVTRAGAFFLRAIREGAEARFSREGGGMYRNMVQRFVLSGIRDDAAREMYGLLRQHQGEGI